MTPYIQSLRLRTLPLSMSGIILGSGLAYADLAPITGNPSPVTPDLSTFTFHLSTFILAICTTLSLQILSNLSNELGDAQKGTDAEQQGRAAYGLQSGRITVAQMKRMIALFIGLSVVFGTALIWTAFGTLFCWQSLVFLGLGALAIIGAMTYTLGKHNYGYKGFGDLGVFLFFGLLSTMGAYWLQTQTVTWDVALAAAAIGLPCVGVLNLNNIRDMQNDIAHGKRTFASQLGQQGGRMYHTLLLVACLVIFADLGHWWTLLILPVWAWHLWFVWTHTERLDKQMPVLMFTTLIVAVLGCF